MNPIAAATALDVNGVIALLALIATVDIAQFTLTLKQDRRLTRVEHRTNQIRSESDNGTKS